jgi:Short C-terminal domain
MPDEPAMVVVRGTSASAIVGTDRRAFLYKQGLMAGATFGHKLASFAYENIVGVEVHTGALTGAVVIHVPGAASVSTSYWQNSKSDAHKAYNAIPIARPYAEAQAAAAQLRAIIAEYASAHRKGAPPSSAPAARTDAEADPLEALRKLGELRDAGIVTPEEFEAKKVDLLSRL